MAKTLWPLLFTLGFTLGQHAAAQSQSGVFLLTPVEGGEFIFQDLFGPRFTKIWVGGLNDHGDVVAYGETAERRERHVLLWKNGEVSELPAFGDDTEAYGYGINNSGVVVGKSFPSPFRLGRAVLWSPTGEITDLETLGGGASAHDINENGEIAGTSRFPEQEYDLEPVLWNVSGEIQHLGNLGVGSGWGGRAVNNLGNVVGTSAGHAFKWSSEDGMIDLGVLPDDGGSYAQDINDLGQVVGSSRRFEFPRGQTAFLWTEDSGMQPLEEFANVDSNAYGINNAGQVVGAIDLGDIRQAVLWDAGETLVLDEVAILSDPTIRLTYAEAINEVGQIIGYYEHVPEPTPTTLNLAEHQFTSIESVYFTGPNHLTHVELWGNQITSIESGDFDRFTRLKTLGLGHNQITSIESGAFDGLTSLEFLDLQGNQITGIESGDFNGLTNLQKLHLGGSQITSIESGDFEGLGNLQLLDLQGNQITGIESGDFDGLTSLQKLDLGGNRITNIESGGFDGLVNLKELYLEGNQLTSIESGAFQGLSNLLELRLFGNQISSIERGAFDGLTNLLELNLARHQLSSIESGDFDGLTNLQKLDLGSSQITSIESGGFDGLGNLELLDLQGNQITSIESDNFGQLTNLLELRLWGNQISSIERRAFDGLTNLLWLHIDDNQIASIESGDFAGLDNLQSLNLRRNRITSIESGDFDGLANLKELYLEDNQLSSIESGAFNWAAELAELDLRRNPLVELNLTGARFDSLSRIWGDEARISSLVLDDAKLSYGSFVAIVGVTTFMREASLDGLTFTDEAPSDLSVLLDTQTHKKVTVDPWLYDWYSDEFEAFDEQQGKIVTVTPKDCNGDGLVSILDTNCISVNRVDNLLEDYGTVRGDADGIGGVEFADFLILNSNFGQSPAAYTDGDFDLDGEVGFSDFLVLSGNFGQGGDFTAGATAAVPEPSSILGLLLAMIGMLCGCRKSVNTGARDRNRTAE